MNLLKEFDTAMVASAAANGQPVNGYIATTGRVYPAYMSNEAWAQFRAGMSKAHAKQYSAGSGGELEEKNGRPPKMASFASSSRMIYLHSRNIPGFAFEEKFSTTIGGTANMDGFLKLEGKHIFVEAKCREPYAHKEAQTIKQAYRGIYQYLCNAMPGVFSCDMTDLPEPNPEKPKKEMRVVFYCRGKAVSGFDIKQMICHLLAVATKLLQEQDGAPVEFLYFLYNPLKLPLSESAKSEIMDIYSEACWAAKNFDFPTIFGHVVDYLQSVSAKKVSGSKLDSIKRNFSFRLCDQHTYCDYFQ